MIVDPDFFDHWKTLILVELLDDKAAPLYVLRLWAHCQNRRKTSFDSLSPRALKALCRYSGHPEKLLSCLVESGFVTVSDCGRLDVCGWSEYNAKLLANWENGKKGGRPKKPTDNPTETHAKPIRVDEIGVDKSITHTTQQGDKPIVPTELAKCWHQWEGYVFERFGEKIGSIEAESMLMKLASRGPEKAAADVAFSIEKRAKSILDSDHDFQKATTASRQPPQKPKGVVKI